MSSGHFHLVDSIKHQNNRPEMYLEKSRSIFAHERFTFWFVFIVQRVQVELGFVLKKYGTNFQWIIFASFQFIEKVLLVKFAYLLDIAEDDIALTSQCLRNIFAIHFVHVIIDDVVQRSNVIAFGANHLAHDQQKRSEMKWKC